MATERVECAGIREVSEVGQAGQAGPLRELADPRAAPADPIELDDRWVRAIGIPVFGLGIPRVTDLLAGVSPDRPAYWIGTVAFVALAAAIWHGNRWLLLEQRRHWGWFDHPARKVLMLLAAIVLFSVPISVTTLVAWYAARGQSIDVEATRTTVLMIVICVVFVTHVYETVFLIKERASDRVRVAELERTRAEAQLAAFLAQVDPHFLFNALHTLATLVEVDGARARAFTTHLADMQRYLLARRGDALATVADELGFLGDFVELMRLRLGDAIAVAIVDDGVDRAARLPTTALQLLVDNAIKHNQAPLAVEVRLGPTAIVVSNERRPRRTQRPSAGVGLRNLDERSRLATGRGIAIDQRGGRFTVTVPLA
ncbi:MAG TPA: histidine kinase [Kofleriaceae bacterium]|nr:histidine kinase [Kofleriaceae bacterium]